MAALLALVIVAVRSSMSESMHKVDVTVTRCRTLSLYRVGLTFVVLVPMLLGVAVAVVPLQLGARSLAFPRLAAAGFWTWLLGALLVVISIVSNGGPGGGSPRFVGLFLVSHIVVVLGLIALRVVVATVPPRRPPHEHATSAAVHLSPSSPASLLLCSRLLRAR